MTEKITALLVQASSGPPDPLRVGLEAQSVEVFTARNCFQAGLVLCSNCPPHLVFTDLQLPDGNWSNVLSLAAGACAAVNVIVVSPQVDVGLYIEAMELGAFDFIVAPLSARELSHVVRVAAVNVCARRGVKPLPAHQLPHLLLPPLGRKPAGADGC